MRNLLKSLWLDCFLLGDRLGVHVLPKHYYSPVPDYLWLRRNKRLWMRRASLAGVEWDLDRQLEWLDGTCRPYVAEVEGLAVYRKAVEEGWGLGYGPIESEVLHCFIRSKRPGRVVEIGSGVSTACLVHASKLNAAEGARSTEITCIEPYPGRGLASLGGEVTQIRELCQAVPAEVFERLRAGDLLFIDSTHSVKVGSEVMRIYLEIIPRLPPGVFLHIHDVYLPYLYPRNALRSPFGWQETALLLALLTNNSHIKVLSCLSALHYDRRDGLTGLFKDYAPQQNEEGLSKHDPVIGHFPSSMWIETI
jgi:predicted O-methyltransferase YrrM